MSRFAGVLAGVLLPVAVVAALSGCSSSSDDDKAQPTEKTSAPMGPTAPASPTAPAAPSASSSSASGSKGTGGAHGRMDYTGALSGGFDVTSSVGCRILAGKLVAVTSPDADEDTSGFAAPSFDATIGTVNVATLTTPDSHNFAQVGTKGVSAAKQGGVWTVTVSGTQVRAADRSAGTLTLNGHLTCTKVHGTDAP